MTWPHRLLLAWAAIALVSGEGRALTRQCGAASDLMVQALERVGPGSSQAAVRDANELLKRSEQMCSELGDTWYYRSLFEARLSNAGAARFSLQQASLMGSQAMTDKLDPFVLAAPRSPAADSAQTGGSRWALVVGVGAFADANIPALRFTAADARLFAATLTDPAVGGFAPDHVHLLLDGEATTASVKASLNWLARNARPADLVVIYIATHGSARDLDSVAGANYLITRDTQVGPENDQDLLFGTALPMNDLVATVANRISARRTAIFIDTCFSGDTRASGRGESVSGRDLQRFGQGEGRMVMTASKADQESRESDALQHGYFTYYLVQALRSPATASTLGTVYGKVARDVAARVTADFSPMVVRQEPVLSRSTEQTDFSLTVSTN